MKRLVEFPLEEGGSILVQVDEPESGGTVRAGREEAIERAKETFEEALHRVLPAATNVVVKLRSMSSKPDEIEVNFGINLSTRAGAFIASAAAEANFGVTVRWNRSSKETTPAEISR
jgi:Trypsin-co-occurring domain 1